MTMSKMPNWPAVSVPIMTQRAPRPCVHSFHMPVSAMMLPSRDIIPPLPPAPALFTLDKSESAGCEMMAAVTPAITPDPSETDRLVVPSHLAGSVPMLLYMFSAAMPCTANLAIVYGT